MEPKKSRKLVTIILVISAVLGLASIATAYYFYNIKDVTPQESSAALGCGCFYLDTAVGIDSCADANPKLAYSFETGQYSSGDSATCSASCDLRLAPGTDGEDAPTVVSCPVTEMPVSPGCTNLEAFDAEANIITAEATPGEEITLKADFTPNASLDTSSEEDFYSSFSFLVNGTRIDVPEESVAKTGAGPDTLYQAEITYSDFGSADTLNVQAFADSQFATDVTSDACLREIKVDQPEVATCTAIEVDAALEDNVVRFKDITLSIAAVDSIDESVLKVAFEANSSTTLTTTVPATAYADGKAILSEEFLYEATNFEEGSGFSSVAAVNDEISLDTVITLDGASIDSDACSAVIQFNKGGSDITLDADATDTTEDTTDADAALEGDSDIEEDAAGGETSSFSVTKSGTPACVERTSPDNLETFTIIITNNDTAYEDITTVVDKLPLGMTYVAGSTQINGATVADASYVALDTVGSAQQITWTAASNWSVAVDGTLTFVFQALVSEDALTGDNLNEVVVTPVNTPVDPDTLRTEFTMEVSQNCSTPETGLFDSMIGRFVASAIALMLGVTFYFTGDNFSDKLATNTMVKGASKKIRLFGLKVTDPRKYFEEKFLDEDEDKGGD